MYIYPLFLTDNILMNTNILVPKQRGCMVGRVKNEMYIDLDLYSMLLSLYITYCILTLYLI